MANGDKKPVQNTDLAAAAAELGARLFPNSGDDPNLIRYDVPSRRFGNIEQILALPQKPQSPSTQPVLDAIRALAGGQVQAAQGSADILRGAGKSEVARLSKQLALGIGPDLLKALTGAPIETGSNRVRDILMERMSEIGMQQAQADMLAQQTGLLAPLEAEAAATKTQFEAESQSEQQQREYMDKLNAVLQAGQESLQVKFLALDEHDQKIITHAYDLAEKMAEAVAMSGNELRLEEMMPQLMRAFPEMNDANLKSMAEGMLKTAERRIKIKELEAQQERGRAATVPQKLNPQIIFAERQAAVGEYQNLLRQKSVLAGLANRYGGDEVAKKLAKRGVSAGEFVLSDIVDQKIVDLESKISGLTNTYNLFYPSQPLPLLHPISNRLLDPDFSFDNPESLEGIFGGGASYPPRTPDQPVDPNNPQGLLPLLFDTDGGAVAPDSTSTVPMFEDEDSPYTTVGPVQRAPRSRYSGPGASGNLISDVISGVTSYKGVDVRAVRDPDTGKYHNFPPEFVESVTGKNMTEALTDEEARTLLALISQNEGI